MSFYVRVKDEGCPYFKENGEFISEVYSVQTMQIPDEEAMRQARLMPSRQSVVPVRLMPLFLVADPDGKFQWAIADKCTREEL